jgi:hypothetical protein
LYAGTTMETVGASADDMPAFYPVTNLRSMARSASDHVDETTR